MKSKSKILILFIVGVVLFSIVCIAVFILMRTKSTQTSGDASTDDNNEDTNPIDINDNLASTYKYLSIASDDTIRTYNEDGEEQIINLSKRNWENVQWSDKSDYVSVLGNFDDENETIKDLSVYDFESKQWSKITNFASQDTGAGNYVWGNVILYFNQGTSPENWLHSYDYKNQTLTKLKAINGEIVSTDPNNKYLVYEMKDGSFRIYYYNGTLVWDLKDLKDEQSNSIVIENLFFMQNSDKLILSAKDADGNLKNYKIALGDSVASILTLEKNFIPVCNLNADSALGYVYDSVNKSLTIESYNEKLEKENVIATRTFSDEELNLTSFRCFDSSNLLFSTSRNAINSWYNLNSSEIEKIAFLKDAKEVNVR